MMWFITGVLVFGTISIIIVAFPISSYIRLFEVLKYMYNTRKIKKKYKKKIKSKEK